MTYFELIIDWGKTLKWFFVPWGIYWLFFIWSAFVGNLDLGISIWLMVLFLSDDLLLATTIDILHVLFIVFNRHLTTIPFSVRA